MILVRLSNGPVTNYLTSFFTSKKANPMPTILELLTKSANIILWRVEESILDYFKLLMKNYQPAI